MTSVSAGPCSRPCCVGREILKEHLAKQLKAQTLDIAFCRKLVAIAELSTRIALLLL